jgi:NAD(P)-dependent dehydrogenase (short-subunit alcohol dehydrogenase family)
MEQNFAGRVAVITGAASGIGHSVAEYLAARGARIVGVDRSESVSDAVAALPGADHFAISTDLTGADAATAVMDEVVSRADGAHILVNSAGIALLGDALDLSAEAWQATINVNLSASFYMAQAAGRIMVPAGFGRIINLASQASVIGLDKHVAYSASKAGLLGMTRVLSMEWARSGVTVNCVSPTVVDTPLAQIAWAGEPGEQMKALIPVGRFARPAEIAALIAYLAGDDAGMITGENILIDGGYSSV